MVLATSIIELILPSKSYICKEYFHKSFLKILKIANIMNFLVKNVVFRVILFQFFFSMLKFKKSLWNLILESLKIVQIFF